MAPLDKWDARAASDDIEIALTRLGALADDLATPDGALFARAALRTWPK